MAVLCHEAGLPKGSGPPKMPLMGTMRGSRRPQDNLLPHPLLLTQPSSAGRKESQREGGESEAHSKPEPDSHSLTLLAEKAGDPRPLSPAGPAASHPPLRYCSCGNSHVFLSDSSVVAHRT